MYRNLPTPTPRLLDREARIVQPTLVKEFIRAVGPSAPRQHRDRINGESKVILASPQGILRRQLLPKEFGFSSDVRGLFQLGLHGTALIGFVQIINRNYIPHKLGLHKGNTSACLLCSSLPQKRKVMIVIFRSTELKRLAFGRPAVLFLRQASSA